MKRIICMTVVSLFLTLFAWAQDNTVPPPDAPPPPPPEVNQNPTTHNPPPPTRNQKIQQAQPKIGNKKMDDRKNDSNKIRVYQGKEWEDTSHSKMDSGNKEHSMKKQWKDSTPSQMMDTMNSTSSMRNKPVYKKSSNGMDKDRD